LQPTRERERGGERERGRERERVLLGIFHSGGSRRRMRRWRFFSGVEIVYVEIFELDERVCKL